MYNFNITNPTQTDVSADYLLGKARNVDVAGDLKGTPWNAFIANSLLFGPLSAIMSEAGIAPNGTEEKVGQSQVLDALKVIAYKQQTIRYKTLAEAIAEDAPVGTKYVITDLSNCRFNVVSISDVGGFYRGLNATKKLKVLPIIGFIPVYALIDTTGVTDVSTELATIISSAQTNLSPLISRPTDIYNVGSFPDDANLSKLVINVDGFRWETNNCTFTAVANLSPYHNAKASQIIFEIEANNVVIGDINVEADTIARSGGDKQGVIALVFSNKTRNTRKNRIGTVRGNKLVSCVTITSTDPDNLRLRGLEHGKLFNESGYYVLNCVDNGDGLEGVLESNDCVRTYFVYGVKGHTYKINSFNHLKLSDILISRYSRDTSDITITYTCHLSNTSDGVISFEHVNDDIESTISNVTVNFGITVSNPANASVNFKAFTSAGAAETQTSKQFNEIRLLGKTNSSKPINLQTELVGKSKSSIYVERDELIGNSDTKGFNFILGQKRVAFSDAGGGMSAKFNVSDLIFTPSWGKLSIFASNDPYSSGGQTEYLQQDYKVLFSVSSDGTVLPLTQSLTDDLTVSTMSPVVTFPSQTTGSYKYVVDISNFTGANRIVKCFLELQTGIATI